MLLRISARKNDGENAKMNYCAIAVGLIGTGKTITGLCSLKMLIKELNTISAHSSSAQGSKTILKSPFVSVMIGSKMSIWQMSLHQEGL